MRTLAALALVLAPSAAMAQRLPPPLVTPSATNAVQVSAPAPSEPASGALMALGGFGGELVGAAAGTVFGLAVVSENRTCALSDGGCPDKVAPWLVAGQSVGGAFAIHLVNHKRGNLLLTMLTNVGIAGAGWLLVRNGSSSSQLTMMGVAVPIGQLIGGVLVERATESQGN